MRGPVDRDELRVHAGRLERVPHALGLIERHDGVARAVQQQVRRVGGVDVNDGGGEGGPLGDARARRAEEPGQDRDPGPGVARLATQLRGRVVGHHPRHPRGG
ncbi:MAG: hypothetical protein RLP09_31540, partial [Sandaracinaceae bacterium]